MSSCSCSATSQNISMSAGIVLDQKYRWRLPAVRRVSCTVPSSTLVALVFTLCEFREDIERRFVCQKIIVSHVAAQVLTALDRAILIVHLMTSFKFLRRHSIGPICDWQTQMQSTENEIFYDLINGRYEPEHPMCRKFAQFKPHCAVVCQIMYIGTHLCCNRHESGWHFQFMIHT